MKFFSANFKIYIVYIIYTNIQFPACPETVTVPLWYRGLQTATKISAESTQDLCLLFSSGKYGKFLDMPSNVLITRRT